MFDEEEMLLVLAASADCALLGASACASSCRILWKVISSAISCASFSTCVGVWPHGHMSVSVERIFRPGRAMRLTLGSFSAAKMWQYFLSFSGLMMTTPMWQGRTCRSKWSVSTAKNSTKMISLRENQQPSCSWNLPETTSEKG